VARDSAEAARVALVTGANRGIGLAVCSRLVALGLRVVLTARDGAKAESAAREIDGAIPHQLDVTLPESVRGLGEWLRRDVGRLDVLVNNAGIYPDEGVSGLAVPPELVRTTFESNALGALRVCQEVVPLMLARRWGRVVNVTSGYGRMDAMDARTLAYKVSKLALNGVTRILADELRGSGVLVNAVDPGWVRTAMGGARAPRSVAQGAETIVFAATLPDGGPTGRLFRDRQIVPW